MRQCCEEKMIAVHATWLHTESQAMITSERKKDLFLIYPLLKPLASGISLLAQKFTEHVTQQGIQAIGPLQGENVNIFITCIFLFQNFFIE